MSIIDLDRAAQPTRAGTSGRQARTVVAAVVAALLSSVTGEPIDSPSPTPTDEAAFCSMIPLLDDTSSGDIAVLDPSTGKVHRLLHCPS